MIGNKLEPFKFWCQKVLPNVYDDSLSYYEYLCKMNDYLNDVIEQINTLTDNMSDYETDLTAQWTTYRDELSAQWQTYKTYIDTYFDNLDVQQEINNKLDAMASDGTLSALIEPFIGTDIQTTVNAWLTEHVDPVGSAVIVDNTLTISGAAADAKKTGDEIASLNLKAITSRGRINVVDGAVASPLNDLDTYPFNSIYVGYDEVVSSLISHYPSGANGNGRFVVVTLEAVPTNSITSVQLLIDRDNKVFTRKEWGSWGAWKQLASQGELDSGKYLKAFGAIGVNDASDIVAPLDNFNTYPLNSIYVGYDYASSSVISNYPSDANGNGRFTILTVEGNIINSISSVQIFFEHRSNGKVFYRYEWGSWSDWHQLATEAEITSIWNDLNPIKSAFNGHKLIRDMGYITLEGGVVPSPLNDLNSYPINTMYTALNNDVTANLIANTPINTSTEKFFTIITFGAGANDSLTNVQMFIDTNYNVYLRRKWGSWGQWQKLYTDKSLNILNLVHASGQIGLNNADDIVAPLDDFNTYPLNSMYVGYDYATSSVISHYPTDAYQNGRFVVITLEANVTNSITSVQLFIDSRSNVFVRKEWGSWGDWHKLLNESYNPNNDYWKTKSIVWLGTSIPAGGAGPTGTTDNGSYPFKAKSILGSDVSVRNNAVGSSSLWVLKKSLIDPVSNPYGFEFNYLWERVAKCIGLTVQEKQWMIDHKSNWADAPSSLTPEEEQRILHYSYEYLVTPYTDEDRLWIFDFTNNEDTADTFGTYDPDYPFDRYSTRGTLQFLWNLILSANPKSSIYVLGNYYTDNGVHGQQNEYFETVAKDWCLPFFRVYEHVSASPLITINTTGGWTTDGYWDNDLYPNGHNLTMKQIFSKDGLHPHSDASGKANAELGRIIGNWINQQAVWF